MFGALPEFQKITLEKYDERLIPVHMFQANIPIIQAMTKMTSLKTTNPI